MFTNFELHIIEIDSFVQYTLFLKTRKNVFAKFLFKELNRNGKL